MASPKSLILVTFLLAALELARSAEMCKTKEDCYTKMDCIEIEGETVTCTDNGTCACINDNSILDANDVDFSRKMPCMKHKDCRRYLMRCIDGKVRCINNNCACIQL